MNSVGYIKEIFYSGGFAHTGMSDSVNEIAFLVDEKYLELATVIIDTKEAYLNSLRDPVY